MHEALTNYYRDNYEMLCKTVAGRAGGMYNAEDVIQETFARAFKYSESYDVSKASLPTWIGRIMHRAMQDFNRQELLQGLAKAEQDPEEPVLEFHEDAVVTMQDVFKDIDKVRNPQHKEVLELIFKHDYRPREVVEVTDLAIKNVRQIQLRFKQEMVAKYGKRS